jgi:polyhydroxyalkanoate synthase
MEHWIDEVVPTAIREVSQHAGDRPVHAKPLVKWAFQLSSFQKLVTKPIAIATHVDDADFLAQIEAVDRFTANMIAYPGRTFGQLYHRFVKGNVLVSGRFDLDDRTISIADIEAPVLVFGGSTDGIAPVPAVKAVVPLLTGSREVRFEIVPGGHLGMLTGRGARTTTWRVMDEWITRWSTEEPVANAEPAIGTNPTRRHRSASSRSLAR